MIGREAAVKEPQDFRHSSLESGLVAIVGNSLELNHGIYKMIVCWANERAIAPSSQTFFHGGKRNRLSFSDSALRALNISMDT